MLIAAVMIWLLNPGRSPFGWIVPSNFGNGLAAGLVAMIPNIFPVMVVFGVMCHMDVEIDIGTMMTASVAMGVAVDDTIHFLSWFRAPGPWHESGRGCHRDLPARGSGDDANDHCGWARTVCLCVVNVHPDAAIRNADAGHAGRGPGG